MVSFHEWEKSKLSGPKPKQWALSNQIQHTQTRKGILIAERRLSNATQQQNNKTITIIRACTSPTVTRFHRNSMIRQVW